MGILSGQEIYKEIKCGNIKIDPFNEDRLNPNSYNLRLDDHIKVYDPTKTANARKLRDYYGKITCIDKDAWNFHVETDNGRLVGINDAYLDLHERDETEDIYIGVDDGIILYPNKLYLGTTIERTWTNKYVPILNGRSSVGRKGLTIHVTAGFGDIGFDGKWTLEMTVVHPLKIYFADEICQVAYFTIDGNTDYQYNGRYQGQNDVTESKSEENKKGMFIANDYQ